MKNMNSRKRVSFGSKGSMVETWIIEDLPPVQSETEGHFYHNLVEAKTTGLASSPEKATADLASRQHKLAETNNNLCSFQEPPTGAEQCWPLRRSQSLESRDNPFVPGSALRQEADDLLKRAIIKGDKFYLDEFGNVKPGNAESDNCKGDNSVCNSASDKQPVTEEAIASATTNQTSAEPKPKENGKVNDTASPDSVKVDVSKDSQGAADDDTCAVKDKKKRNKCCSIM